jgi:hypothetical protein
MLTRLFAGLAILELGIIIMLLANRTTFVVKKTLSPITIADSPIALAAQYDAPDKKFEEVVKSNLGWIEYRPLGDKSFTVLGDCACERKTNYVRILIENGADVKATVKELNALDPVAKEGAALIKSIDSEVNGGK